MFLQNRVHEISVQAYNETTERGTGGLVEKTKGTIVTLCVLWLPPKKSYRHTEKGTNINERARFQVSSKQLEDQSFTIITGETHIIKDGYDYRVMSVRDASYMNYVQLKECELMRKIPIRSLD